MEALLVRSQAACRSNSFNIIYICLSNQIITESSDKQSNCSYVPLTEGPFWGGYFMIFNDFQVNLTVRGPAWTKVSAWSVTLIWWNPVETGGLFPLVWLVKACCKWIFSIFTSDFYFTKTCREWISRLHENTFFLYFQSKTWCQTSLDSYSLITGKSRRLCSSRKKN